MSLSSENRSKIQLTRIPRAFVESVDAHEFPIRWARGTPTKECWTVTVLSDKKTGDLIGAAVYNDEVLRGSFFKQGRKAFHYVSLNVPFVREEPSELLQYATAKLAELLGPTYLVKCGDSSPYSEL